MKIIRRLIHSIFSLLFGDFNGVQVFLYPLTIFWWMDSDGFIVAITSLLTMKRYFFPLCIFLLLILYIAFMIVKNSSSIFNINRHSTIDERSSFYKMIIGIHKILLFALFSIGLIYVLSAFLGYYYNIQIPLKTIYPYMFRGFSVFLVLYYTLKNIWTKPFRDEGFGMEKATQRVRSNYRKQPQLYILHAMVTVLMILIGAFLYNHLVVNLFYPITDVLGYTPKLLLIEPVNFGALFYDVFIFGVALMLSNLLFSPIVIVISYYSNSFFKSILLVKKDPDAVETKE